MQNIEEYLKENGFKENDWGFLSSTIDNIQFTLLKDPFSGYSLSYAFISSREAANSEIPLGKKPLIKDIKESIEKVKQSRTMYIKIKIMDSLPDDLVSGTFYLKTKDKNFVEELKKYVCPFRLTHYLTEEENKSYTPLKQPLKKDEYSLIIDLSSKANEIIDKKIESNELFSIIPDAYIKSTPYLDKYGCKITDDEIEVIESLYGLEKYKSIQTVVFNKKTYIGWYIEGYETIKDLRVKFPLDSDIERLYKLDH